MHMYLYLQILTNICLCMRARTHTHTLLQAGVVDALYTCTLASVILTVRPALREKVVPELRDWKVPCWTWGLLTGPNCPPRFPSIPWLARFIWEPCKELRERSCDPGLGDTGEKGLVKGGGGVGPVP